MRKTTALAACLATLCLTTPALACSPVVFTDQATGESYSATSPRGLARQQAQWREESAGVVLARIRSGRLMTGHEVEFTLTPVASVYGGPLPEGELLFVWQPGNTCNRFNLTIADAVVAFVRADGSIAGLTIPAELQDRPEGFDRQLRELRRGEIVPDSR